MLELCVPLQVHCSCAIDLEMIVRLVATSLRHCPWDEGESGDEWQMRGPQTRGPYCAMVEAQGALIRKVESYKASVMPRKLSHCRQSCTMLSLAITKVCGNGGLSLDAESICNKPKRWCCSSSGWRGMALLVGYTRSEMAEMKKSSGHQTSQVQPVHTLLYYL